ncbi:MAG: MipA/OmpV family protein [Hyphomicrobiales bacterium]|nr:MAG: MipA/OmpV family protein [Hyphomicrobiales bacterium]
MKQFDRSSLARTVRTTAATVALALGVSGAIAGSAQAQYASDGGFGNTWQIGAGVVVVPKFEGAKTYQAVPFPFIAPSGLNQGTGFVQVRGLDDFRLRFFKSNGFEAGLVTGYRLGRDSSDSSKLAGFNDINGGLVLGGYAGYRAGPLFFSASYHHQVTGDDTGGVVRLLAEHTSRLDRSTTLTATVATNIASKDYMQTYFGVTPAQAGLLPVYSASAGFKDVSASLTAAVELDPKWTLYMTGKYTRLVGDAADSPVIDTPNQFFAGAGLTYKFDWGRW